jgi:crossover junction endodeoxyribonuclease RusA
MIVLPWPDKRLSPNARLHWRAKAPVKARARADGANASYAAYGTAPVLPMIGERLPLRITFYPPDRRHRDDDNMIGALKSYRDGIAGALGVNDRCFAPQYIFADPVKGGKVTVEIGA